MPRPSRTPLGLLLTQTAREVERAFDRALAEAGGTRPRWLVLRELRGAQPATQLDIATAVGIRGATLSHHLASMETDGLVTRVRNPENRREHQVRLTPAGEEMFERLVGAARAHDARLRRRLGDPGGEQLRELLGRLTDLSQES